MSDNRKNYNISTKKSNVNFGKNSVGCTCSKKMYICCTHCKLAVNSVDKCFNLHGYPLNFKDFEYRKLAATSHNTTSGTLNDNVNSSNSVPQYQQLMDLFNKQATSNASTSHITSRHSEHALLAGKMCMLADTFYLGWLVDNGATNYMCTNLSLFLTYKPCTVTNEYIVVPDGRHIHILHVETVTILII